MRKTRMQKGITLIALIITIIILLILAVVTIGSIKNSNIISYAQNASSDYNKGKDEEESVITGYESLIELNLPGYSEIGKAEVGQIVEKNSTINGEPYSSSNPIIPAGFAAINIIGDNVSNWDSEDGPEIDKGLVITDNIEKNEDGKATIGSEFVWVPVSNINDMVMCQEHGAETILDTKTLKCNICGENGKLAGKLYSEIIGEYFNSTATKQKYYNDGAAREPDIIIKTLNSESHQFDKDGADKNYENLKKAGLTTDLTGDNQITEADFKVQLQKEFNSMAMSIAKYGGFYVGRYEMSLTTNKTAQSKYGEISSDSSQNETKMWYGLYEKSKTYLDTRKSVQSSMMWGSQYDAMMRWIANGDDSKVKNKIGDNRNKTRKTGTVYTDMINNICDLYGNSFEVTLEAYTDSHRIVRGGNYNNDCSISYRGGINSEFDNTDDFNSRIVLYIK